MLGLRAQRGEGRSLSVDPQAEATIRDALETLLEEASLGGLVKLREPRTRRELQFAVDFEKGLRMIVPHGQLERDEAKRARLMFDELAGMPSDPADTEARDLQALFSGDPGHAARAALKVFTWVFGLPPGFALEIEG